MAGKKGVSKPRGWRYESSRHSLAARGVKTRYDAAKSGLGRFVEDVQSREKSIRLQRVSEAGAQQRAQASIHERAIATSLSPEENRELAKLDARLRTRATAEENQIEARARRADAEQLGYDDAGELFKSDLDVGKLRVGVGKAKEIVSDLESDKTYILLSRGEIARDRLSLDKQRKAVRESELSVEEKNRENTRINRTEAVLDDVESRHDWLDRAKKKLASAKLRESEYSYDDRNKRREEYRKERYKYEDERREK